MALVMVENRKQNEKQKKTLIKSNCSIDCRRTLKCLELEFELRVCDTASSESAERTSERESVSIGASGKPSIFRKSDTFIRAVDSPTESPNCRTITIFIKVLNTSRAETSTSLAKA